MPYENRDKNRFEDSGQEGWVDLNRNSHHSEPDASFNFYDISGRKVKCPECGTVNIEHDQVEGETCSKCGMWIDNLEEIKTGDSLFEKKIATNPVRLSINFHEPETVSEKVLALPDDFPKEEFTPFKYVFRNSTINSQLMIILLYSVATYFLYPFLTFDFTSENASFDPIMIFLVCAWIWLGLNLLLGLSKMLWVTTIVVDQNEVGFYGTRSLTRLPYSEIISVENDRVMKGFSSFFNVSGCAIPTLDPRLGGGFGSLFYPPSSSTTHVILADTEPDESSSSSHINNVTISSIRDNIYLCFVGGGNTQFIRALAVIICMAKKQNKDCSIEPSAIKAAERGGLDYGNWEKSHTKYEYKETFEEIDKE